MDTCIKIMSVLCLIGWSYELCTIADTNPGKILYGITFF